MAQFPAIATVGMAILHLLATARPKPEFVNSKFELYQSSNFELPMDEGISLYLYRVTVNGVVRNPSPRMDANGKRRLPPLPLDLHFLLTAWAKTAEKQQRLLGWTMQQLEDFPVLSSGFLNSLGPEPEVFYPQETVELVCEPIPMPDMVSLWENLKTDKTKMQISVTYVARMVMIESSREHVQPPEVQTRNLRFAQKVHL
jgi:hypothetical protein